MQKHFHISNGLRLLGVSALLVGVFTAAYLYQSFGAFLPEKIGYGLVGVIFAAAGGLLLPAAVALWNESRAAAAGGVFAFWLMAILPLGLSGHAGFFSVAQADLAATGLGAQAATAKLQALEIQAGQYQSAGAVDVAAIQTTLAALQSKLQTARAALAACPANHKTNCINPKTQAVGAVEAEIQALQAQLGSADRLAQLNTERATAAAELAAASSAGAAGSVHPLFNTLAELFAINPIHARAVLLGWSAVSLELLAALTFVIAGTLAGAATGNGYQLPAAGVERPETVPALDTGGKITADGIAHLHQGETVLNRAAVEALERLYPGLLDAANNGYSLNAYPSNGYPLGSGATRAGAGICNHCGGNFDLTRTDKEYCSESCRVAAWENRTGAKLRKGKGNKGKGKKAA